MFALYGRVAALAARRAIKSWPIALAPIAYAALFLAAATLTAPLGMVGGFVIGLVVAACWSSYLELISQSVAGGRFRVSWSELRSTFGARFWDVVSVMFAFWIISFATSGILSSAGDRGPALRAILAIAMAFFFNAIPELLYQGQTRSFALLLSSARFMLANPVVWLLPNLLFAAAALGAAGQLNVHHPAELLLVLGTFFSSPQSAAGALTGLPLWSLPLALIGLHYVMIFRGILYGELTSGGGNSRLQAFRSQLRP